MYYQVVLGINFSTNCYFFQVVSFISSSHLPIKCHLTLYISLKILFFKYSFLFLSNIVQFTSTNHHRLLMNSVLPELFSSSRGNNSLRQCQERKASISDWVALLVTGKPAGRGWMHLLFTSNQSHCHYRLPELTSRSTVITAQRLPGAITGHWLPSYGNLAGITSSQFLAIDNPISAFTGTVESSS